MITSPHTVFLMVKTRSGSIRRPTKRQNELRLSQAKEAQQRAQTAGSRVASEVARSVHFEGDPPARSKVRLSTQLRLSCIQTDLST